MALGAFLAGLLLAETEFSLQVESDIGWTSISWSSARTLLLDGWHVYLKTDDLQDHIVICGFGRVGQIIAQLLSERLIPFVALDVSSDRVTIGRSLDLPVYFGDAGSREVLHKIGAGRACAAVVALDAPGANYRCVWALSKYYPNLRTFEQVLSVHTMLFMVLI